MKKLDPWADVREHLSPATRALLPLPDYAQASANPYSMANYATLVEPLIDALAPKHFCEIGSDRGENTQFLLAWCAANDARLTIVDPLAEPLSDPRAETIVTYRKELSLEYLARGNDVDVFFVDGDHNYETVRQELDLIRSNRRDGYTTCVFVHDTCWPCARRDFYYLPDSVEAPHRYVGEGFGISPYAQALLEGDGYAVDWDVAIAVDEGGPRNGVLTAIEDFFSGAKDAGWRQSAIPSLFGLHILWHDPTLTEGQRRVFEQVAERLNYLRPFLTILELNRIVLLCMTASSGEEWKRQRARIAELEAERTRLTSLLSLLAKWPLRPILRKHGPAGSSA